jgi:hypothetical protein
MRKFPLLLFVVIIIGIEIFEQASVVGTDLNEIALKIMGKNGGKNVEERQLEKCRKVSAAIAWSILWELELIKMENDSSADALGEGNKSTEDPKILKKLEQNVGKFYSSKLKEK